jgi:Flp pilus assembly protein TadG
MLRNSRVFNQLFSNFWRSDKGVVAIEFIMVFPAMCLMFFGALDVTSMIMLNKTMTSVSTTVSDTVAQYKSNISRAQVTDIENAIKLLVPANQVSAVQVDVYDYYLNGTALTKRWSTKSPNGAACNAPATTNFANMMGQGNDVIVAVSCMNFTPWLVSVMGSSLFSGATSFKINETITTVPYASKSILCTTVAGGATPCAEI